MLDFRDWVLALQNKFGQTSLNPLDVTDVLQCKVHHTRRVVCFLSFVQNVKSLQILTFTVALYLLLMSIVLSHATKNWCLPVPTFAFYEDLCLTRELCALFGRMAMLTTAMTAIGSDFLTNFSTWMMLMGLFTALLMALDQTLVSALKQLCTFVQA